VRLVQSNHVNGRTPRFSKKKKKKQEQQHNREKRENPRGGAKRGIEKGENIGEPRSENAGSRKKRNKRSSTRRIKRHGARFQNSKVQEKKNICKTGETMSPEGNQKGKKRRSCVLTVGKS